MLLTRRKCDKGAISKANNYPDLLLNALRLVFPNWGICTTRDTF